MGDDDITLISTTDTPEQVQEALVGRPEKPAEKKEEPPPDAGAEEKGEEAPPAEEAATEEEAAPKEEETPAEKAERQTRGTKRKQTIAEEINELTRTKHTVRMDVEAEEARLADLRRQREEIEHQVAKPAEKPDAKADAKPDADGREEPKLDATDDKGDAKYATYEDYLSDHAKWTREEATLAAKRVVEEARNADRARIEQESASRAVNERLVEYQTHLEEFKKTHVDFDAAYEDAKAPVQQLMVALGPDSLKVIDGFTVFDAEDGPALTYYLLKHPDELKAIAMKAPPQQLIHLSRLEERIRPPDVKKPGPSTGAAPKTRAPEPIKPVGSAPTATTVPIEDEPYQEWKARRERELRARRGA
jgi:hypothetical protein